MRANWLDPGDLRPWPRVCGPASFRRRTSRTREDARTPRKASRTGSSFAGV